MVAAEKQTSPAVTGCVQVFAARERRAALSSPRGGGALSSVPTTEKRKRAHKAAVDRSDFRVIKSPHGWGERGDNPTMNRPARMVDEHLLRAAGGQRESSIARPPGMVIGERKRSSCSQSRRGSLLRKKASWRARGSVATSIALAKRARATFQNRVWGKCSRQKTCQRAMVRRSAPKRPQSSRMLRGEGSCRMAAAKKITAARYTFRPRNRVDGGVTRLRQPSRSQHRLNR